MSTTTLVIKSVLSALGHKTADGITMYSGKSPAPRPSPGTFDESASRVPDYQYPGDTEAEGSCESYSILTIAKISLSLKVLHFGVEFSPEGLESRSMIHVLRVPEVSYEGEASERSKQTLI
jgi:hypothetical protein